jgi:hypothetical protein
VKRCGPANTYNHVEAGKKPLETPRHCIFTGARGVCESNDYQRVNGRIEKISFSHYFGAINQMDSVSRSLSLVEYVFITEFFDGRSRCSLVLVLW